MSDDTYNGWANRETWAFWLHVTNDQGWYEMVREFTRDYFDGLGIDGGEVAEYATTDHALGESVVEYVKDTLGELQVFQESTSDDNSLRIMRDDIGSFWRIDYAEIGAAARELVSES